MAEPPNALGGIIKAVRRAHGMSGMQFAVKLGVALDTLRSWEIGRSRPDADLGPVARDSSDPGQSSELARPPGEFLKAAPEAPARQLRFTLKLQRLERVAHGQPQSAASAQEEPAARTVGAARRLRHAGAPSR